MVFGQNSLEENKEETTNLDIAGKEEKKEEIFQSIGATNNILLSKKHVMFLDAFTHWKVY